jgi:hypothetical protein
MGWDFWIKDEDNWEVSLRQPAANRECFDELSDAELDILDDVFEKFGKMQRFEIARYTHDHCAEWEDPHGSSFPISPESVFRALEIKEERIQALVRQHRTLADLDTTRSALR